MGKVVKVLAIVAIGIGLFAAAPKEEESAYKCMVQLTNYQGEGAYMVISLIDPHGKYEKTLYVMGQDEEWYPDMEEWWKFAEKKLEEVDGISGATVAGGERTICLFEVDDTKLDAGYKLRFETAVEDQQYYVDDVEIDLTSTNVKGKFDGKGYIRYIRIMPS